MKSLYKRLLLLLLFGLFCFAYSFYHTLVTNTYPKRTVVSSTVIRKEINTRDKITNSSTNSTVVIADVTTGLRIYSGSGKPAVIISNVTAKGINTDDKTTSSSGKSTVIISNVTTIGINTIKKKISNSGKSDVIISNVTTKDINSRNTIVNSSKVFSVNISNVTSHGLNTRNKISNDTRDTNFPSENQHLVGKDLRLNASFVPTINNVKFSDYIIKSNCPFNQKEKNMGGDLLIAILSGTAHFKQRKRIRNELIQSKLITRHGGYRFYLGLAANVILNKQIKQESDLHEDIVQANFSDTYRNLTMKTMTMVNWVTDYCSNTKFVLKMDDDMTFNISTLYKVMQEINIPKEGLITGNCISKASPIRDHRSKWYVPVEEYHHTKYPPMCFGPSYLISGNSFPKLRTTISKTPFFRLEDVYLTGMVRANAGVKIHYLNHSFFGSAAGFRMRKHPFVHGII